MRRLCECGAADDGKFCSKCGRPLEDRPVLGPLEEIGISLRTAAGALARYPKTFLGSCRLSSSVYTGDAEDELGPLAFLSTSLVLQGWALYLILPADPFASLEVPPPWRNVMNAIEKLPLSLPAYTLLVLLASTVVPWLVLRAFRKRIAFQPILRMYCYLQGGPATVILVLIYFSILLLDNLRVSSEVLPLLVLPGFLWLLVVATWHLSVLTSTSRWICLPLLLATSLVCGEVQSRVLHGAIESFQSPSHSIGGMWPTYRPRDIVLCNKLIPRFRPLRRHEVVVFNTPDEGGTHVGRLVGMPGEVIAIRDKQVRINDQPLDETTLVMHSSQSTYPLEDGGGLSKRDNMLPYRVPLRAFFILGDNRDNSWDSRFFGAVPVDNVVGVVYFRIFPPSRSGLIRSVDHSLP